MELRDVLPAAAAVTGLIALPSGKARMLRGTLLQLLDDGTGGSDAGDSGDAAAVAMAGDVVSAALGWCHTGGDSIPLCHAPYVFVCPRLLAPAAGL